MARVAREQLNTHHQDEAGALIHDISNTEPDLIPDRSSKTLTIALHSFAAPQSDAVAAHLCAELTATETTCPGADLRMIFKTVSP